jgi:serine/threonine protein kinase
MLEYAQKASSLVIGRYVLHAQIAFGGTATIHVGRLVGPIGFARTVAIKRLHGSFSSNPAFVAMFMDEARLAARIRHPNVVSIIDVVAENGELLLVMDYVHGESLAGLLSAASEQGVLIEPQVTVKIISDTLRGLHAAHELKNEIGTPLGVVHRDVSPQNILVAVDGVTHLIDFGIAKAIGRVQHTQEGQVKGKLRYMAPEQIEGGVADRRTDIFAAAVVLWEALAGKFLFSGNQAHILYSVLRAPIPSPRSFVPKLPKALESVVMKGLERNPDKRFATALEMEDALEAALRPARSRAVARRMQELAAETLAQRARLIHAIELDDYSSGHVPAKREFGSLPTEDGATSDFGGSCEVRSAVSGLDFQATSGIERHTQPLPQPSFAPHSTSAVHYCGDRPLLQRRVHRHWLWMVGFLAVATACIGALLAFSRVRTQVSKKIANSTAHAVNQSSLAPQHSSEVAISAPLDSVALPAAEDSSGISIASLPNEPEAAQRSQPDKPRTKRGKATVPRKPTTPAAAPAMESPAEAHRNPLYIRD